MRYGLSQLRTALASPRVVLSELNRLVTNGRTHRTRRCRNPDGVDVIAAEWDTLILLDACRYDAFAAVANGLPGTFERRESVGSHTTEFLWHTFHGRELTDTVYVTANPQLSALENADDPIDVSLHDRYEVWQDHWDHDAGTVRPEAVTAAARAAHAEHPHKRLIIHYLQPHAPYLGPTGREIDAPSSNVWSLFRRGEFDLDLDTAVDAYHENLAIVLDHVEALMAELDGLTVVTADHGELLGERDWPIPIRQYGHPRHTYLPAAVQVPWLEHQVGPRRTIIADEPTASSDRAVAATTLRGRLADLGYIEA